MYTVIRFFATGGEATIAAPDLVRLLRSLAGDKTHEQDLCDLSKTISLSVSSADDRDTHVAQIEAYLNANAAVIKELLRLGLQANLDIAIEPEDRAGKFCSCFRFGGSLLNLLGTLGIELEITVYSNPSE